MPRDDGYAQTIRVFISYRRVGDSEDKANSLHDRLRSRGIDAFLDTKTIQGGDQWRQRIYGSIREADVLVILIASDSDSQWLQREVDIARGALVSILPVRLRSDDDISALMDKYHLDDLQYIKYPMMDDEFDKFIELIRELSTETRDRQRRFWHDLNQKRETQRAAGDNPHYVRYTGQDASLPEVYLATGDLTKFRGIDVLVNTENNYMQMGRVFENTTLSSTLRWEGSQLDEAGRLLEDTVQMELNEQINAQMGGTLPVMPTKVLVTRAGHPESRLVNRNRARFIFHVATVTVSAAFRREKLTPLESDHAVKEAVTNCLDKVAEVNRARGVIATPDTERYHDEMDARPDYRPIESIVLPMFGTGMGGRRVDGVAQPMARAIREFINVNHGQEDFGLRRIYLCVYSQLDVETVENALDSAFSDWSKQRQP